VVDWPGAGRSGFSDGPYLPYGGGSARREGLMSYKQFIAELEDDILPGEAERRYIHFFHSTRMLFCSVICVELSQVCTYQ
jgi:hypothetical protein